MLGAAADTRAGSSFGGDISAADRYSSALSRVGAAADTRAAARKACGSIYGASADVYRTAFAVSSAADTRSVSVGARRDISAAYGYAAAAVAAIAAAETRAVLAAC